MTPLTSLSLSLLLSIPMHNVELHTNIHIATLAAQLLYLVWVVMSSLSLFRSIYLCIKLSISLSHFLSIYLCINIYLLCCLSPNMPTHILGVPE